MFEARPFHTTDISTTHIKDIAAMEQQCFPTPWSFASCAAELSITDGGGYAATCGDNGAVAGYIFYRVIIDEMHILKVATAPSWRNRRIATLLMGKSIALAREKGLRQVCLEVRASNVPAINLYYKCGFGLSGRRPGYYDNREDAVLMTKNIEEEVLAWQRQ